MSDVEIDPEAEAKAAAWAKETLQGMGHAHVERLTKRLADAFQERADREIHARLAEQKARG